MIDGLGNVLWLAVGLASVAVVGYGVLVMLLPWPAGFTSLERAALGFGLGALIITQWMLILTFGRIPFTLVSVAGPWLVAAGSSLGLASRRQLWRTDLRRLGSWCRKAITLGHGSGLTWMERTLLALLLLTFCFALLRATLYPLWAWDAVSTWGLKAKAFYLSRTIDLSRFEAHNYYPNLIPLLMAYLYLWLGGVEDHLVKALFPLWGGCLLLIFYRFLRRSGVGRQGALLGCAFLVLNGATLIVHLFIAYADLALSYYMLAAAGLLWLWLRHEAPDRSLLLIACCSGGMMWSKYEGWPLVLINFMAAAMTLVWLRPPGYRRKFVSLALALSAAFLFYLPWRGFCALHQMGVGADHLGGFYPAQLFQGARYLLQALVWPPYFGVFWPTVGLALFWQGRSLLSSPTLFLGLMTLGNLAAIALAYALVPASAAEFPLYVRNTLDRLLLHVVPAAGLILAHPLAQVWAIFPDKGIFEEKRSRQ